MPSPARIFTKNADLTPLDWRRDEKLVAAQERLAAVQADLTARRNRLASEHDAAIARLDADLARAEMEVLAGRGSENALAAVQARHTAARVARARDALAAEDLAAEAAALDGERIPALRRAAKRAALASIRRAYRAILTRLRAGLDAALDADADLAALITDTGAQFGPLNPFGGEPDADGFPPCAGLRPIARTYLSMATGGATGRLTVEGQTKTLLDLVDAALAALDADEGAGAV